MARSGSVLMWLLIIGVVVMPDWWRASRGALSRPRCPLLNQRCVRGDIDDEEYQRSLRMVG
jgi:hypothetical protein